MQLLQIVLDTNNMVVYTTGMKKLHIGKKTVLVTSVIVLGVIGGTVAQVTNNDNAKATTSPLVQEVNDHSSKLNNHEARIQNLEGDTKDLQARTGTTPSTNRVAVPTASTAPANTNLTDNSTSGATTTPTVVVTAYREIVIDADNSDCEYTYSDGTTYRFSWKKTNPQGAWVTDGSGQNGHWQKSINTVGYCDQRAIGMTKN